MAIRPEGETKTLATLIARIILLILKGISVTIAVSEVAQASNSSFSDLWDNIPNRYK